MTYNMFGGTLNLALSIYPDSTGMGDHVSVQFLMPSIYLGI